MRKKVLICGASGFIGRNLFETLSQDDNLEVFGTYKTRRFSDSPNLIQTDLTKKEEVEKVTRGMDVVIQAAAVTTGAKDVNERPYIHITNNVIMNALLFQAAHDNNVSQVIFLSCTTVYPPTNWPVKETDLDLNAERYEKYFGGGWMKIYAEKLCQFYSKLGNTKFTVIRHSNIYGPYDKYDLEKSHVFGATMTKVITNQDGKIIVWGDGQEKRDLIHVSDLVDFIEMAVDKRNTPYELYNVGSGKAISVSDLVKKTIDASGKNLKIKYDISKPTIKTSLCVDTSKAKNEIGWEPKVSLEEGIKKTMEWYKKNIPYNQ